VAAEVGGLQEGIQSMSKAEERRAAGGAGGLGEGAVPVVRDE
jgi:hypothetical protein